MLLKHSKDRVETKGRFHLEKGSSECNTSYKSSYSISSGSNSQKSYLDAAKGAEDLSFGIPKTIIKTSNSRHNKVKVKCLNSVANSEYTIPGKVKANEDGTSKRSSNDKKGKINIAPLQIDLTHSDDEMSQVSISPLSESKSSDSGGWNLKECYKGVSDFKNRTTLEKETNLPSIDEDIYNNDVIHSNELIVNGKSTVDLTTSDSDSS